MTHPTPEQERAAEERLRSAMHEYAMPDGGPTPRANVESSDLALLLSLVERQREALKPFAQYGAILRGQLVRHDRTLIELFDCQITVRDLICAADSIPCAALGESNDK